MCIKVICDGSKLGLQMKLEVESIEEQLNIKKDYVIRWGNWIDKSINGISFNNSQAIKNTEDKETMLLTLRRHHISCPMRIKPGRKSEFPILGRSYEHESGTDIRVIDSLDEYRLTSCDYFVKLLNIKKEYRIHVMDLNAFYAEEKYDEMKVTNYELIIRTKAFGWNLRSISLEAIDRNVMELSQKAVYGLGLDFGVVSVGIDDEGKAYVLDVDAWCKHMDKSCKDAYINQFFKTIKKYENLTQESTDVTIGADPECIVKDKETGSMIFASEFLKNSDSFGLDDRSIEAGKKCFPLMELRPQYSTDPREVADSIKEILVEALKYINYSNIGLYSGSMPSFDYWAGGHIHFGIKPNSKLIRALDNYLALPILMIEKSYTARRRMIKYGALGNYRMKSHGGFEYCTLSSWLVSPRITSGVLCLAKVVAEEYLNLQTVFLESYSDLRAYYLVNKNYFMDKTKEIINNIRETKTYKKYEDILEPLFERIIQCSEWREDKDIKETWGLSSSDRVYKLASRCYIPKKKRAELSLLLEDNIEFKLGGKLFTAKVYPKDDLTSEKQGYISFSEDIYNEIQCTNNQCFDIWRKKDDSYLRVGPVFGILAYKEESNIGPFGGQSYYFRKLIKFSKEKGMLTFVFTLSGLDWEQKQVKGYTYDFRKDAWIKRIFPLPDVVYDRGDIVSEENFGTIATEYRSGLIDNDIKSINSLECINLTNDKWETCQLLESSEATRGYQIETCQFLENGDLSGFIKKYDHIFLKPKHGSRSKGIFSIEKKEGNLLQIIYKDEFHETARKLLDIDSTIRLLNDEINRLKLTKTEYIIQKAIPLMKYKDRSFEIRVVMQKNSSGFWHRTCMVARITGENEKFINVHSENDAKSSHVLKACFEDNYELVRSKLRRASKEVSALFDERGIIAGEISIDFGLDKDFNLYIIELNSKPDNLLFTIGAFKLRSLAINRILEYGKFLTIN